MQRRWSLMAGNFIKCGMTKPKGDKGINVHVCGKKAGHHLTGGRDNRSHVDNKQSPIHRWESCVGTSNGSCGTAIDPHSPYNSKDGVGCAEFKCDDCWLMEYDRITELARRGVY